MAGLVQQAGPAAAAEPTDQDVHNMNIARLRETLLEGERRCEMLRTQLAQAEDEQRGAHRRSVDGCDRYHGPESPAEVVALHADWHGGRRRA